MAAAQRLGAQALVEDDLDRALLLARQGVALDDSVQTRSNLFATLLKSPAAIGVLRGDGRWVLGLDLSPDGRRLAFIDLEGQLRVVDTATRRVVAGPAQVDQFSFFGPGSRGAAVQPGRVAARGRRRVGNHPRRGDPAADRPPGGAGGSRPRWPSRPMGADRAGRRRSAARRTATSLQPFDARNGRALAPPRYVSRRSDVGDADLHARRRARGHEHRGRPDRHPRRPHAAPARAVRRRRRYGGPRSGRPDAAARRQRRHRAVPRPRHGSRAHGVRAPRRGGRARDLRRERPHRRHGRRGQARDRLGRGRGGGPRHARRPRRPDHRGGDQPRRRDAVQLRLRLTGRRLGSGGRPAGSAGRSRRDRKPTAPPRERWGSSWARCSRATASIPTAGPSPSGTTTAPSR